MDSDCKDKESYFAGYCGETEPLGDFIIEFNMRTLDGSSIIICEDAGVDNISITVSTHGFSLEESSITLPCSLFNIHEIADTKTGPKFLNYWSNESYEVTATFEGTEFVKTFTVQPTGEAAPSEVNDANIVKFKEIIFCETANCNEWETCNENTNLCDLNVGACGTENDCAAINEVCIDNLCVAQATLTAKWFVEDEYGVRFTNSSSCTSLGILSFRVGINQEVEPCTTNELSGRTTCDFTNYVRIPCIDDWSTSFIVDQSPINTYHILRIYGVTVDDSGVIVLFENKESSFKVSQEQFDAGTFERTFTLKALGNKK